MLLHPRGARAAGEPQVCIQSSLMDNYVAAQVVSAKGQLVLHNDVSNEAPSILVSNTKGHITYINPDDSQESGYASVSLSPPLAVSVSNMALVTQSSGADLLLDGQGYDLTFMEQDATTKQWPSSFQQIPMGSGIVKHVAIHNYSDVLYAVVLTAQPSSGAGATNEYNCFVGEWQGASTQFAQLDYAVYGSNIALGTDASSGKPSLFILHNVPGVGTSLVVQDMTALSTSRTISIASGQDIVQGQIIFGSDNNPFCAAILADSKLYYVDQTDPTAWAWHQLDDTVTFTDIALNINDEGTFEIFGVGSDTQYSDVLFHTSCMLKSTTWEKVQYFNIDQAYAMVEACHNKDGHSLVYAVTSDDQLLEFAQSPMTTDWSLSTIEVNGDVHQIQSYTTIMQFVDADGINMGNIPVAITCSSPALCDINGKMVEMDPEEPVTVTTNPVGRVTLVQYVDALRSPVFKISAGFMSKGETICIQPNKMISDSFKDVTGPELGSAKKHDGSDLIPEGYNTPENTDALATAFDKVMEMENADTGVESRRYIHKHSDSSALHTCTMDDSSECFKPESTNCFTQPISPACQGMTPWALHMEGKRLILTELDEAGYAERVARIKANAKPKFPVAQAADDGSIVDFFGEVVEVLADGAGSITDHVFKAVEEGMKVTMQWVEQVGDSLESFYYEAILPFAEMAYDLIQTVFNHVKVFFEDIYNWLSTFFDFGAIKLLHQVMTNAFGAMIDFGVDAAGGMQTWAEGQFDVLSSLFDGFIADYVAEIEKTEPSNEGLYAYAESNDPAPDQKPNLADNVMMDKVFDNADAIDRYFKARGGFAIEMTDGLRQSFTDIYTMIENLATSIDDNDDVKKAMAYFDAIGDNPDDILKLGLLGLIQVGKVIGDVGISLSKAVVDAMLGSVKNMLAQILDNLTQPLNIPFISQMYNLLMGNDLGRPTQPLELFTLALAIPSNLFFKLATGESMFTSEDEVYAFGQTYSANWLCTMTGFGSSEGAVPSVGARNDAQKFLANYGAAYMFMAMVEGYLDIKPLPGTAERPLGEFDSFLTVMLLALQILAQFMSNPWVTSEATAGKSCKTAGGTESLTWICQWIAGIGLNAYIAIESAFAENEQTVVPGIITAALWGVVQASLYTSAAVKEDWCDGPKEAMNILSAVPNMHRLLKISNTPVALKVTALLTVVVNFSVGMLAWVQAGVVDEAEQ